MTTVDALGFTAATSVIPAGPGRFIADLDPAWTVVGKPNGGYLFAILGRAATLLGAHPHVVAASAHFLRSPVPGPVFVHGELLRGGRSASQVRVRMSQDDHQCVEALMTLGPLEDAEHVMWDAGLPRPAVSPYERCSRLVPDREVFEVALMEHVEVRLDPGSSGFVVGEPSGRGELQGWLSLPDGAPFDPVSLLFALDAFPPATFDVRMSGWVPTLELTAYVRGLPAPGPVQVLHRAQLVRGGRVDETCFVWDSSGQLVAQSTQLASIRL